MRYGAAFRSAAFAACSIVTAACTNAPHTDAELAAQAQNAVNHRLDAQATYSMMEAAAGRGIACGHARAVIPTGATVEKDFVYRDGKLILEDDDGFDAAAAQCDAAIGGDGGGSVGR